MIKPNQLKPGDTIAVLSPSWGGPSIYPHIYEDGLETLIKEFGFTIKEFPTARMDPAELYHSPRKRAEDINNAFRDKGVQAIICTIGGDDSIRILKYLDTDAILNNPKLIMGYSDSTTVLAYLNSLGLVTYYGSSVMAGFSHIKCFPESLAEYKRVLFTPEEYTLAPYTQWTEGYMDWNDIRNRGQTLDPETDGTGHRWIKAGGKTVGETWGGCMEVLTMMNGTPFWPDRGFFCGKILFIETSEEKPTPKQAGYFLRNLGIQGILEIISGLLVARPKSYTAKEKEELDGEVKKIVVNEFGRKDINIVTNIDIGHTDPRHIMPLGIRLEMDPHLEKLTFIEPLFA